MTASVRPTTSSSDAPPFAAAWAVLACVLAAMTLGYPALSGGFLVSPVSDQYIAGYPFREFAAASLRAGEGFPLWNPYLFGGMPYVAAMHGDIFYPTFLLRLVLPTDVAMTWGMILHLMLAGVAGYGFLRVIGVGFYASLVGGIAYMMGGQVASLVSPGHDGKLFVSALLPVTLIVLTYGIRDAKRWAWGALALVVGLGVLSPHPQLLQYLLLTSGAWALLLAFVGDGTTTAPARGVAIQRLAIALGAVILGGAIGAIQYLPVREYVDWSPRTGGRDYEYATSFSMPIEELINTYLPQFSGILDKYWGRNGIHLHSEYIGAGVLFLMVLGVAARRATDRRALTWFWAGTGIVSLFWALGGNTPFYHLVYAIVPGSKFFRAPSTIFFVTTFAVSVLAAFGAERLLRGEVKAIMVATGIGTGLAVVFLAYAGVFESMALSSSQLAQIMDAARARAAAGDLAGADELYRYLADQEASIRANTDAVISGAWRSFLFFAAPCALALLVRHRPRAARAAGFLLVSLVVADLWSVQRLYWTFSAPAAQTYASDEAIVRVQQEKEPVRVITAGAAIGVPGADHDPNLEGDGLMHHRVRVALGYHGNELGRYQQLGGKARGWDQISNPAFWGLMNVKYFYTTLDSLPIPGARRVVGPVRSAAGSTVYLHELPGEQAYAWVVPTVAKYPDAEVAEAVRAPNFPYRSVALLDPGSATAAQPLTAIPEPLAIRAVVDSFAPGHARLTLDAPAPAGSALVVSENFYPGWTATIDGKPAVVERANLSLMAVTLPAGARRIELTFDSAPYHTGKQVTIAAICLALVLMTVGFFVRPRGVAHG